MKIIIFFLLILFSIFVLFSLNKKNNIEHFFSSSNRPTIVNRYVTIAFPDSSNNFNSSSLSNSALGIKKQTYNTFKKKDSSK